MGNAEVNAGRGDTAAFSSSRLTGTRSSSLFSSSSHRSFGSNAFSRANPTRNLSFASTHAAGFGSARFGATSTRSFATTGIGFRGAGYGGFRGAGIGFRGGYGCWGCGFRFGLGFGWGWGWGSWWGPWGFWGPGWGWSPWWNPWWYDSAWGWDPYWDYPPANYNVTYPPEYSGSASNDSYNYSTAPLDNTSTENESQPAEEGTPDTNPMTGNVAASTPTILVYLKDGTTYAASDYWVQGGKLHFYVDYSGETTVDMSDFDLQRTVDENAKRGIKFTLKPKPNTYDPATDTTSTPTSPANGAPAGAPTASPSAAPLQSPSEIRTTASSPSTTKT